MCLTGRPINHLAWNMSSTQAELFISSVLCQHLWKKKSNQNHFVSLSYSRLEENSQSTEKNFSQ